MTTPVVVLDVVGLTPTLLQSMPRLRALARDGFAAPLDTVLPAVTCTVQSTFLTGRLPRDHGAVGNGWYFRDLGEVLFWRQHNALVQGEKVWERARRARPDHRSANLGWWYAMGASTDLTLTPRPVYHADGRKSPDCYTWPPELRRDLTRELGPFPLFQYWGPTADLTSSRWIADAARHVLRTEALDLLLVYLPHLDYDLQRYGPDDPRVLRAASDIDEVAGRLAEEAREGGATVVVVSEYGITAVDRPVDLNQHLRRAGLLHVHEQQGMEYLDPWTSRAFAVADHQVAHVYVDRPDDVARVAGLLRGIDGVDEVLDADGKRAAGLDHPRAGDLVVVAEPGAWFTYRYWLDEERAPDFAATVEIHRKPGYDPAELFFDPDDRLARPRAALTLARRKLGFRGVLDVVPLDPSHVRGSHGRLPDIDDDGPVLLCSDARFGRDRFAATDVADLLLEISGGPAPTP
ncbi:nucleotide pyrophosphatase/phosphodiesterase family protein [Egicoccus halophilus]|uniref:Alkaline phosphatase family protein n=1 Tax=Egicoccus halophilus TaxID=1670830 RepID=A0A8J3ESI9_9ACTN|nr:nucleotide pyrophosphatase/phosphodiesterase family protein [Egicoccus halophilus]GGI03447.1 alkaline phosphatase family protein [Egicoccus halophilus]